MNAHGKAKADAAPAPSSSVFGDLRARNERRARVARLLETQRRSRVERALEAQLERWARVPVLRGGRSATARDDGRTNSG
jgi:hypothetical protein